MEKEKLIKKNIFCEICNEIGEGIIWNDGEYDNSICFACIDEVRD